MMNYDLMLDAIRLDYMLNNTPCVLASNAKIDILNHQISAVKYILGMNPVRIMLADDVGLGKTIMTGLAIKELLLRGRISRVLIVVPKSLINQWWRELNEKFDINPKIIARSKDLETTDLSKENIVITSIDLLARRKETFEKIKKADWDLVVFDEAHNLTVRTEKHGIKKTLRYQVAEELSLITPNIILLTATPHHGKFKDFVYRLRLLDPNVPEDKDFVANYIVSNYIIRRLREEVKDANGNPIIPERESTTITINLNEEERKFYNALLNYLRQYFNIGFSRKSRAHVFAAYVFQKRASSSIYAIVKTLERRQRSLNEILQEMRLGKLTQEKLEEKIRELERRGEWYKLLKYVVLEPRQEGIERELNIIEELLRSGNEILSKGIDSKFEKLIDIINTVKKEDPDRKVIIFTQYRDTLNYLIKKLKENGFNITFIHGGLDLKEREEAERELKKSSDILVATDAASEGLNLQVASVLVNYDLPWNPSRIDQRIGRIHRYGQKKKVLVFNLLIDGTIDNHVYEVLFKKINEIKETLGKVYDYLGTLVSFDDIKKLIKTMIEEPSRLEKKVDQLLNEKIKKEMLNELEDLIEQNRIVLKPPEEDPRCRPEDVIREDDVETFVLRSIETLCDNCIKIHKNNDKSTENYEIYKISPPKDLTEVCPDITTCYVNAGTFNKELSERLGITYLGLDHPLVQALIKYWLSQTKTPIVLEAENPRILGWLLILRLGVETNDEVPLDIDKNIKRKITREKLVTILYDEVNKEYHEVPLSIIKEIIGYREPRNRDEILSKINSIIEEGHNLIEEQYNELKSEAENELKIIREEVSTKYYQEIKEWQNRMVKTRKPQTQFQIQRKIDELFEKMGMHMQALNNIEIDKKKPDIVAAIRLVPIGYFNLGLEKAKDLLDIGRKGEEIVMEFEKKRGCNVIDFRDIFTAGFDFMSFCQDHVRYIEVKTVSSSEGTIYITQREWEFMQLPSKERRRYAEEYTKAKLKVSDENLLRRIEILEDSIHLYIVDLENNEIIDIKNPITNLYNLFNKYKKAYIKVVIPYVELINTLKGNFERYKIK